MIYTVRYAHLEMAPSWKVGATVYPGMTIGIMGSSGQSTANHLHLDVVCDRQAGAYTLADIDEGAIKPAPVRQLLYFADRDLFGVDLVVTTPYADVEYFDKRGKVHYGLDLVPYDRHQTNEHFAIRWNRSAPGRVVRIAYDQAGYGHHVQIAYEAA